MNGWELAALTPVSAALTPPQAPLDIPGAAPVPLDRAANAFAELLQQGVAGVGQDLEGAEQAVSALAAGRPLELHEVMISLERARMSVQTFVQVRNKLVEAYQDLMRMQL